MLEQLNPSDARRSTTRTPTGPRSASRSMSQDVQEPELGGDHERAHLQQVAARHRPPVRLRVPPVGAPGPAERRRAGPLDPQEPAPRHRARRPRRGVPRRPSGAPAPRSRRAVRVGVQPDRHVVGDVQRGRPPRVRRRALDGDARGVGPARRRVPRRAPRPPDRRRAVHRPRRRSGRHGLDHLRRVSEPRSTTARWHAIAAYARQPTRRAGSARTGTTSRSSASTPTRSASGSRATSSATTSRPRHPGRRRRARARSRSARRRSSTRPCSMIAATSATSSTSCANCSTTRIDTSPSAAMLRTTS